MLSTLLAALALAGAPAPAAPVAPTAQAPETPTPPAGAAAVPALPGGHPVPAAAGEEAFARPHPAIATPARTDEIPPPEKAVAPEKNAAEPRPTPRAISGPALVEELRDAGRRRQQELGALRAEREQLEKLKAEIETARAALREETARLEARVQAAGPASAAARGAAGGAVASAPDGKGPVDSLARTLKGMKPDQAAGVVNRIDRPLAVELLRRLRPGDAAALLERMKPEAAAELFVALAGSGARK